MSGTLFVVATPIGNLEDITLRALRTLREADLIAAEDTRRTARLLAHYGVSTPTVSFHEHNRRMRLPQLLARLNAGARIALVTDAGTPGVSDPGTELVSACIAENIRIDPIPGPSAPLAAAVASGFSLSPFTLLGFPPARGSDRIKWLKTAAELSGTFCFFEAPHRIIRTLRDAAVYFGHRPIVIARELTKLHQEFVRGTTIEEILNQSIDQRGEFTVVVGPVSRAPSLKTDLGDPVDDSTLAIEFGLITKSGAIGRRAAIAELAERHGRRARDVYAAIERGRKSVK